MTRLARMELAAYCERKRLERQAREGPSPADWTDYFVMIACTHALAFVLGLIAGGFR